MPSREWPVDQYNLSRAHATCQGFMGVITWLIICLSWGNPWRYGEQMEDLWDNLYRDKRESKSKSAEDILDGTISWEVWT